MRRVGLASTVAVAVVALVAPLALAPVVAVTPVAPAVSAASADTLVAASGVAAPGPAVPAAVTPRVAPPVAVPSEDFPGGTSDGVPVEDPANGAAFDIAVTATPPSVEQGGAVDVSFTVTNHDVPMPEEGAELLVALSWNTSQFWSIVNGDAQWANPAGGNYRYDVAGPRYSGSVCVLSGMDPGESRTCSAQFRHLAGRPASTSQFTVEVASWARAIFSSLDDLEPIAIDPGLHALATAAVETAPVYDLSVENYDFLGLGAVGSGEPVLGRYAILSTEVALRSFDDAELVVRLSWPEGMTLVAADRPSECVADGTSALICTIEDAHLLQGMPEEPVDYDDFYPRVLREWDLHFIPPWWQSERERHDSFDIGFVSGWTYRLPEIDSLESRPLGGSGTGVASMARVTAPAPAMPPTSREAAIVPAASDPPEGGFAMTPEWTDSDSAPFTLLYQVFATTAELSDGYLSGVGDQGTAVFTVTHHPDVTTALPDSIVSVRLYWPDFVEPLADPVGCTSYADQVCTIEGLDEPGATAEITMEFEVVDAPGSGLFELGPESVIVVETNSDGSYGHEFPDSWIEWSSARLIVDDELVTLDVVLSDDVVWEGGRTLWATITATRAERPDDETYYYDLYGELVVGVAITWPDYLTPALDPGEKPTGCDTWDGLICEIRLTEPGPESAVAISLPLEVGPGVTDGVITAEGAYLQDFDGEETEDLPIEWVVPDEAPVTGIAPFIPLDVVFLDEDGVEVDEGHVWPYGPNLTARVTVTRDPIAEEELRDPFGRLGVGVLITWPAYLTPVSAPEECVTWEDSVCTVLLDEAGSSVVITMVFLVGEGVTDGVVRAEGSSLRECGYYDEDCSGGCDSYYDEDCSGECEYYDEECSGECEYADDCGGLPIEWIIPDEAPVTGIAPVIPLDVEVERDLVWEGDENVGATVTVTRNAFVSGDRRDPFGELVVDVEIIWPMFLSPAGAPTGCESWDGSICDVVLPEPGSVVVIGFDFEVGAATPSGLEIGEVRARATRLVERYEDVDCDSEDSQCTDLPVGWVTPDEDPVSLVELDMPLSVHVERELVWQGGEDVETTILVSRYPGYSDDSFDEFVGDIEITWPAFLEPTAAPTGCESWDGRICRLVLPDPNRVAVIGLEFSVRGMPPGNVLAGDVSARATRLVERGSDGERVLPTRWVSPGKDSVTRIRARVSLDLTLGHDPGYTGGKQLVVTTKVTRETTGPELPDLEVGLDFAWAAYLTRTAQTGCATFTGTTCTVTGLDDPGASAVVTLTFRMPAPTLPPVPEVLPRTDDISVDGITLSFMPPPPADADVASSTADTGSPPAAPTAEALPPSWISQDRAPFTVLQPSLVIGQSVATPGDGVRAYGRYLPPNAKITLRWEGLATMAAQQWPNPDAPTEPSWSLVILRWQFAGPRTLIMHSEDGLFADIPSSNQLLVVPRSGMGPDLVGRGG